MAASDLETTPVATCEDFQTFQVVLKQMRTIDDRLIHALNKSIPTASFSRKIDAKEQCRDLFDQLLKSHHDRENLIKKCIGVKSDEINLLRERRMTERENPNILQALRKQQSQLRLIQNELGIEEVVQDTANKVFYERCRLHYTPPKTQ